MPKLLLHIEGLAVFALSFYIYHHFQFSWILFVALLFVPDLAMLGYFINPKLGSMIYNLFHTYTVAISVLFIGLLLSSSITLSIGIIWLAHIGMDRLFGFGLKYPTAFKDTHFNRV
ncbi:DUF4260 domain-containing protein [Amphibacillus indicireducens]|uniref:DUF4260 domain-containing protein n=1 Tax=Amphibacillus indicireducens TaxID=1076330 RepID=A0ABP7W4K7_9BACI